MNLVYTLLTCLPGKPYLQTVHIAVAGEKGGNRKQKSEKRKDEGNGRDDDNAEKIPPGLLRRSVYRIDVPLKRLETLQELLIIHGGSISEHGSAKPPDPAVFM